MSKSFTKSTKNYVKGSAKLVTFPTGGELINLDLNLESLSSLPISPSGYVKLTLSRRQEPDQYGNNYSIYENEFKPKAKDGAAPKAADKPSPTVRGPRSYDKPPF